MKKPVEKKPVFKKEEEPTDHSSMIKELKSKIEKKNRELTLKNMELVEIKKQLQKISKDALSIKNSFEDRKNNVDGLKNIIKKQEDEIKYLDRQVDTNNQLISHLNSIIEKKNNEISLLNKKMENIVTTDKKTDEGPSVVSYMKSKKPSQTSFSNDDWVTKDLKSQKSVMLSDEERMFRLLNMIYPEDINDVSIVKKELGVSDVELKALVDHMVSKGFLRFTDKNEAEITPKGINYVTARN